MSSAEDEIDSIEKRYQKKSPLEHVLLRPDSYVGSIKNEEKSMWIYDKDKNEMVEKTITYNPALYKIFDEILVNASDNKIRDKNMTSIKIDIKGKENMIRVWNNGEGIPVVKHKDLDVYVPTMIFGQLLTSTNFNDDKKQVTGGRNGLGAKLCNIFSSKFILETSSSKYGKKFKQTWTDNMTVFTDPEIEQSKTEDYTCVTFYPDLKRFGMTHLDENIIALFCRRAYDIAACTNGINVRLNGEKLPIQNFKDYVELYTKGFTDGDDKLKVVYEKLDDRWEVAMTTSVRENFTQVSFVNSIATTKGGSHVNYVTDQAIAVVLAGVMAKKKKEKDIKVKPTQVKNNLWVFVRCLIENPTFDSQTKENMTLNAKDFGSKCDLSEKFKKGLLKCGVVEKVSSWMEYQGLVQLNKVCSKRKVSKLSDIEKLDDANMAGTKNSMKCRLFLTEGDSAKTLAVSGMSVCGRDYFGVFPLKGKMLNAREASSKQLSSNEEITKLLRIFGLQYTQKYETEESLKSLRYGKLVLMTDQDQDGSHIKGLVINFIHSKWPNLLKHNFIEQFITPIVKVSKKGSEISFYSIPEYNEWEKNTPDSDKWNKKYYKGLGTSTSTEAKEYFSDMERHLIPFKYSGVDDGKSIIMAFAKDKADERKDWLTNNMEETKRRRDVGLDEDYLYGKGTKYITFNDFINKELVLFSNTDNMRSIPCMVDGFKPGQRKVLFACFKRNLVKELKVAQLAGSVAELSAYHHGEASLMSTIINLAQDFVGSNNLNLLVPKGQFGTRLTGGKDSASPRYIFTLLSKITRLIFHPKDEPVLKYLFDDNQQIEPEWYAPIIPMVLVNGCDGIGTGWSSKIPNFNPLEIIANVRRFINDEAPIKMHPWYKGFRGTIQELLENKYHVSGEISKLDGNCLEITELPIRSWTATYKESVIEVFSKGSDKCPPMITDYKEYNTDTTVRFVVEMSPARMAEAESVGFHKFFKLQSQLTVSNMILFDEFGVIRKYNTAEEILLSFCKVRLELYIKRKDYLIGELAAEALKLENQARFILEKIDKIIIVEDIDEEVFVEILTKRKYDSDPIKAWRKSIQGTYTVENVEEDNHKEDPNKPDYTYLRYMRINDLTKQKKIELLAKRDSKLNELEMIKQKSPKQFWIEDLDALENELKVIEKETPEPSSSSAIVKKSINKKGGKKVLISAETLPSAHGMRIEPKLEEEFMKKLAADAEKKKKQTDIKKQKQIMADFFTPQDNGDLESSTNVETNENDVPLFKRLAAKGNNTANDIVKKMDSKISKVKEIKRKKPMVDTDSDKEMSLSMSDIDDDEEVVPRDPKSKSNDNSTSTVQRLSNPLQSSLDSFVQRSDKVDAKKPKILKDKNEPATKKVKVDKPTKAKAESKAVKPKASAEPKTAKTKANAEPKVAKSKANAEPKAVKTKAKPDTKKPSVPRKKAKLSSDDCVEDEPVVTATKARRNIPKKKYNVFTDEESDEDNQIDDDSDFDFEAHDKPKRKNAILVSDSD